MTMYYYYCYDRHISLLVLLQCIITTATTDTFYRAVTIYKSTLWQCIITTAMTMYYYYCNYRHISLLVLLQCIFTTVLSLVLLQILLLLLLQCIITTATTDTYRETALYCNVFLLVGVGQRKQVKTDCYDNVLLLLQLQTYIITSAITMYFY